MIVRSSEQISALCRDLWYRCENDDCGAAYTAQLAIVKMTRASAIPNPDIVLPLTAQSRRPVPANDESPPLRAPARANDDDPRGPEVPQAGTAGAGGVAAAR